MSYQIYQGEIGLRAEVAQLKAERARLLADNARLRAMVGEQAEEVAPLHSEIYARATSSGAKIGTLDQVGPEKRAAAISVVMGQSGAQISGVQAPAMQTAPQQAGSFENADGCKVTIGALPGATQLNPAIQAARARPTQRPVAPVPVAPQLEPEILAGLKNANTDVDEDDAVQRFSQMELR